MSIDSTRPILPLSPLKGSDAGTVQPQKSKTTASTEASGQQTQVNLSDAQARLREPSDKDINTDKVNNLKDAIRRGDLQVNTGKIADAVIANAQSMVDE
ncbi:flagellar biosynthesis anti-sigma factor FlgM [Acerihabitans sp. TG2]|uniref:flagellar biosynthesis anti-sigma factor FlgM n=1 Tax=Acerihabitans sp. TG2 TaxID=3096008 RepID=UPI002B23DC2D|nr:flagellar biosynthesis anti-sigma factor FlgM [Acerihabitans sp. TG2]MEA9392609.1 flagellar biosynthesis anti-sigma factor FlgM [Acerihabitans sp. TG2]